MSPGPHTYLFVAVLIRLGIVRTSGRHPITPADVHRDRRQGCLIGIASVVGAAVWMALVWIVIVVWRW